MRRANSPRQSGSLAERAASPSLPVLSSAGRVWLSFERGISPTRIAGASSISGSSAENTESQKSQTQTLDASAAPHCKQVFVTGRFALRTLPLRGGGNRLRISPAETQKDK